MTRSLYRVGQWPSDVGPPPADRLRPGRAERLREFAELVAVIETREPQLLTYGFYLDQDEEQLTVLAVHPDWVSLDLHLQVGDSAFWGFADVIDLQRIEVYGDPGSAAMDRPAGQGTDAGESGKVRVHRAQGGFTCLGAASGSAG